MFWYGILLALGVAWILPGRMAGLLFVIALLATGLLHSTGGQPHSVGVPYVLVAVIAALVGLYFGRICGPRQLGESDFRVRCVLPGGNQPLAVAQVTCPHGGKRGKNQEEEA
jgi:hypothetical protein